MPDVQVVTVCLPKATPSDQIATAAAALLAAHGITEAGPVAHFLTSTRRRKAKLVQPWGGTAAGGPVRLLDLARMRAEVSQQYGDLWQLWRQIVAGSPAARPWWHFYDRFTVNPDRYTWDHARHGFNSQPRVARMVTYNSHHNRLCDLPLEHLEAFEAGPQAYATYGWLQAVPCDRMLTLDGQILAPTGVRYTEHLEYLRQANEHIARLAGADLLVAIATR
ncbi:hypothetical protein [Dactylosporangium salmoneum]|uniref:Uncharacterized protein n=1 Tax=Dactylosporangium salmoneum TaxID=53361 RepID=A0ABP5THD3_9ACTN